MCKYQQERASTNKTSTTKQNKTDQELDLFRLKKSRNKIAYKSKYRGAQQMKIA